MPDIRTLIQSEADAIWASLVQTWDIAPNGVWWFPLVPTSRTGVVAFEAQPFYSVLGPGWLQGVLADHGVDHVLRFPEFTEMPVTETPLPQATFRYEGAEAYWCAAREEERDWLVYVSHEDSVTLGGAWLVQEALRAWIGWRAHLWNHVPESYRASAT